MPTTNQKLIGLVYNGQVESLPEGEATESHAEKFGAIKTAAATTRWRFQEGCLTVTAYDNDADLLAVVDFLEARGLTVTSGVNPFLTRGRNANAS